MPKFYTFRSFPIFVLAMVLAVSCQDELEDFGETDEGENIETGSLAADLIIRTISSDGSFDNIIDGASCLSIEFPYTVTIGDQQITLENPADFDEVEFILDDIDGDSDDVQISFPIEVITPEFEKITVANQEEFDELAEDCLEGGDDDDIECVDFVYPVRLFVFDTREERGRTIQINSDRELRLFFKRRRDTERLSIEYPLTLEFYDGTRMQVDSTMELMQALDAAEDQCDEDDDNNFNDDDFEEDGFTDILQECPWEIKDFLRNNDELDERFRGSLLEFEDDGELAFLGRYNFFTEGEWSVSFTNDGPRLEISIQEIPEINGVWFVHSIDTNIIRLFQDRNNRIRTATDCEAELEPRECNTEELEEALPECRWKILESNIIDNFNGRLEFEGESLIVLNGEREVIDQGSWFIEGDFLIITGLTGEIEGINGQWRLTECHEHDYILKRGNNDTIILRQDCMDSSEGGGIRKHGYGH